MKTIEGVTPEEVALEVETWVRATAQLPPWAGALAILMREDGSAIFSLAGYTPETRLRLGALMAHLGQKAMKEAVADGADAGPKKPPRLVGIA